MQRNHSDIDDQIHTILTNAPGSVTLAALAAALGLPRSTVRAGLDRLRFDQKAFMAGTKRTARYGSTLSKAGKDPAPISAPEAA